MKCGLLGRKLAHSYSPAIHRHLGDYEYTLMEREPEELDEFFRRCDFDAINVTIPYKEAVMKYCSSIDETAKKIGSVNTIVKKDGKLLGYNTDYFGFKLMLERLTDVNGKKVLVLGSGGSSKTVCAVVRDLGGEPVVISRTGENNYENISRHYDDTDVIVNTTPVGMYPNNLVSPIKLDDFTSVSAVLDIIFNPSKTKLLLDAERLGIPCSNGLSMLVAQAKRASELFCDVSIPDSVIDGILRSIRCEVLSIVLVGMPGSGKSVVGKRLAKNLGREFVDADKYITDVSGRSPREIIEADGEAAFRRIESDALRELCKRSSCVIATGGGAVTVKENFDVIRQNSVVFYLKRDIAELQTSGRPLSAGGEDALRLLFERRREAYSAVADFEVESTGVINKTADVMKQIFCNCI